jgi:hypothetical protein
MDRSIARIGAWAGVLALIGIFGYHLALMAVAGQRVSGTGDAAAITAYYRHEGIAALSVEQFVTLVPMLVFAVALRTVLAAAGSAFVRFIATVAMMAVIVEIAVIMSEVALQAALVTVAQRGGDVTPLFRVWDVLYNSGAYALEATWVFAFGVATRGVAGFPGWLRTYSYVTAALLAVNVGAIWIGIPDAATLPSALFLGVWLGATSYGLGRIASAERPAVMSQAVA